MLLCEKCGERSLFWKRQYVRVDFPVNGAGVDNGTEDEVINWQDQLGVTDIECGGCGSLEIEED